MSDKKQKLKTQSKTKTKKSGSFLNYVLLIVVLTVIAGAANEQLKTPVGKNHLVSFINSGVSTVSITTRSNKRYKIGGTALNEVLNQALLLKGNMLKEKTSGQGQHVCTLDIYKNSSGITFEVIIAFSGNAYLAKIHRKSRNSVFYYDGKYDANALIDVINQRTKNICQ